MATSIATRGAVPGPPRGLGAATRRIAHRRSRSRFGTLLLRAEKDDDDAAPSQGPEDDPRSPANLMRRAMSMRAKNIKVKLASLGVSSKDLFEKEELARALANAWGEKLKGTVTLPLRQLVGMPGNPRAGYVVVTLDVGEAGFVDFLIDSGATNTFGHALLQASSPGQYDSNSCSHSWPVPLLARVHALPKVRYTRSGSKRTQGTIPWCHA